MVKFSIVIPAYNVESFLRRCVESCECQDVPQTEYEVIIVNDGSKDKTLENARQLSDKYSNIKIVDQENAGLSVARNVGLDHANGEYIWFVDSDDWIKTNCLGRFYNLCKTNNLDCLKICAADVLDAEEKRRFNLDDGKIQTGLDFLQKTSKSSCAPFSIFSSSFLKRHKLYFYPGIFHEDYEFNPRMLFFASRVMSVNEVAYYVYQNPNSITRTYKFKKYLDLVVVANNLHVFFSNKSSNNRVVFSYLISQALNSSLGGTPYMTKKEKKEYEDLLSKNVYLFAHFFKSGNKKYFIEGILFWLFPKHIVSVYRLLNYFVKSK